MNPITVPIIDISKSFELKLQLLLELYNQKKNSATWNTKINPEADDGNLIHVGEFIYF